MDTTTETTKGTRYYTSRTGRAFSCDAKDAGYRAMVDADGTVTVYDSVAGHYTIHHRLTAAQERHIRANAR